MFLLPIQYVCVHVCNSDQESYNVMDICALFCVLCLMHMCVLSLASSIENYSYKLSYICIQMRIDRNQKAAVTSWPNVIFVCCVLCCAVFCVVLCSVLCCVVFCVLFYAVLCCAVVCCVVLCCVVLCCVVLCCVVLCCVVLCCVVLCCVVQ